MGERTQSVHDYGAAMLDVFNDVCERHGLTAVRSVLLAHVEGDGPETGMLVGDGFEDNDELVEFLLASVVGIAERTGYRIDIVRPDQN